MNEMIGDHLPQPVLPAGSRIILLVDDDPLLRAGLRHGLQEDGYRVIEADNTTDALSICRQHGGPLHLLAVDVSLPPKAALTLASQKAAASEPMNGVELARRVVALHPETRVMFISGHDSEILKRYGALHSETVFLQKPFARESFVRHVHAILDGIG